MTKFWDDGVTAIDEANLRKMLGADGTIDYACWGLKIRYTGAAWEAFANTGATDQIANVVLTWNAAAPEHIEIDTSSCDNPFVTKFPTPIVTPEFTNLAYPIMRAHMNNINDTHVYFYDASDTRITTEDNKMYFHIIWFGSVV